jgi:hypothetical protein
MTGLGPESNALLEVARDGDEPTHADRDRVRAAIELRLALGAGAGLGAATAAKSAAAAAPAGLLAKAIVTAGIVCAVGVITGRVARTPPRAAAPTMSVVTPIAPAPIDGPTRVTEALSGAQSVAAPAPSISGERGGLLSSAQALPIQGAMAASSTRSVAAIGDVAAEVRLLDQAHTALRGGDAERALGLLEDHGRRYPKGALGEERDAARIAALCALGRTAEARDATDRFLRAAPRSPQAGSLRASCGGSPAPVVPPILMATTPGGRP